MSFQIHLGLIGMSNAEALELARSLDTPAPLSAIYDRGMNILGNPALAVSEIGEGTLANSLLTDDADWNDELWTLRAEVLAPLSELLQRAFWASSRGLIFRASWISDRPQRELQATVSELAKAIADNRVPNRTIVVVPKQHVEQHRVGL
jgi:hypothetical protein